MTSSQSLFELAAASLAQYASLSETAARGTLRIAMKDAGLRLDLLTAAKVEILLLRVVPRHLAARGIKQPQALCEQAAAAMTALRVDTPSVESPDDLFRRVNETLKS